jgi:hypothetical protein
LRWARFWRRRCCSRSVARCERLPKRMIVQIGNSNTARKQLGNLQPMENAFDKGGIPIATTITNAALIAAGKELLVYAQQTAVPYVAGGMTLVGMDCQGLAEYLLMQCGVPRAECNLAGSNAHFRKCVWTGTPEACCEAFGSVPGGAFVFIWEESGAPAKYDGDGLGNAEHMGVYLGDYALHASSSRGMVAQSAFAGKTIPNGGWNRVGLAPWVDYGLTETQQATLNTAAAESATSAESDATAATAASATVDTSVFFTVKKGCKGGAVRRLQTWLADLGYDLGVYGADGDFGTATDAAVRAFQLAGGLAADGAVGQNTWRALAAARQAAMEEAQG